MRNLHLILALAASLPFATVQAAPANLPETGQVTCYNAVGAVIACTGTGQDGELKAGVAWPSPRFTAGAGTTAECVTDNLTGLMWVRVPSPIPVIWTAALTDANSLTLCGFSDWRLPNINEIESLVNCEVPDLVYLNNQGFSGVQVGSYWSSSSYAGNTGYAWSVDVNSGFAFVGSKSVSYYVWPVRAGQ